MLEINQHESRPQSKLQATQENMTAGQTARWLNTKLLSMVVVSRPIIPDRSFGLPVKKDTQEPTLDTTDDASLQQ